MFLTAKSSIAIKLYERTKLVVNLCKKSVRASRIRLCIRATLSLALCRLLEHDFFPTRKARSGKHLISNQVNLTAQFLLRCFKFSIQFVKVLGVGYFFIVASTNQTGYASVNSHLFRCWWQYLNSIVIHQQRNQTST